MVLASLLAVRLALLAERSGRRGLLVVVDGDPAAESLARLIGQLAPERPALHMPSWDCLPYDRVAPSPDVMGRRMRALATLTRSKTPMTVVTTPEAIVQRVPARPHRGKSIVLRLGTRLDAAFGELCSAMGYTHADHVEDPGQMAIRSEVVDVFPAVRRPYRIGLLDGRVTAIQSFDPATQRTVGSLDAVRIDPVSELVTTAERFPGMEHWLPDFVAMETLFDVCAGFSVLAAAPTRDKVGSLLAQVADAHRERRAAKDVHAAELPHPVAPERLFLTPDEWEAAATGLSSLPSLDGAGEAPRFCLEDKPGQAFIDAVGDWHAAGLRVVLAGARDHDLQLLGKQADRATKRPPATLAGWGDSGALPAGTIGLLKLAADHGFVDHETGTVLVTAADLLGHHFRALSARAVSVPWHLGDGDFALGDLVIHLDHGVGVLKGLERIETADGGTGDAVRLGFAKDADLIVPVEELDRVWRYGGAAADVALDRLDTAAWPKRLASIAREIEATAHNLVTLARERQGTDAPKIVPPRRDYERFVAGFPYAPTADQMHAIDDCLRDLASGRPMDRLVVGDVGFGKTEVALRAAAAAVLAGRQVAVVAPTTVLARQHAQLFERRFAALGFGVAHLSRLVSAHEAEAVKAGLRDGAVRIVVGTQALAGDDIGFKDLGLLIIDEEQRFGTADKLAVRGLGRGVHVLTLTATPIPRTLQSALVGLQSLSLITTPPARRRPIRTLLAGIDAFTIRSALLKERARNGQSFIVVPRIEDLEPLAAALHDSVPELSVLIGHGRMDNHTVDDTMTAFAAGGADVLLATSIIESGLDVPRANLMIICHAERFGLAELHQLRGRVGRGTRQGLCYLMTDADHASSATTERRLATLARLDRLGSGMAISAQDLDARGAGDLGGDEQAGHMHLVGLGLSQHLLQRAIREMNGEDMTVWTPELHLGDAGLIPADYVPEPELRLNLYARIARLDDVRDIGHLAEEVEDRFGPVPDDCRALFARARLRSLCRSHRIARVDAGEKAVAFTPVPGLAPEALLDKAVAAEAAPRVKNGRLLCAVKPDADAAARIDWSERLLQAMA